MKPVFIVMMNLIMMLKNLINIIVPNRLKGFLVKSPHLILGTIPLIIMPGLNPLFLPGK